jgi:2-C-methyl-D-erythritol 4-phosphate cytidylyltransferase
MKVVAIVIADASGSAEPDALASVHGAPLLSHAVRGLLDCQSVELVVVTVPARRRAAFSAVVQALPGAGTRTSVIDGGGSPAESTRLALDSIEAAEHDVLLVHDVARAFTPSATIEAVAEAVHSGSEVVVPVLPVTDTVKRVDADDVVTATEDRERLRSAQTPQGFTREALRKTLSANGGGPLSALDSGLPVRTVPGHPHALRMTTPFDLILAEAMLSDGRPGTTEEAK